MRSARRGVSLGMTLPAAISGSEVIIDAGAARLRGSLDVPAAAGGLVLFAHGSGSGRHSTRNQEVARSLRRRGLATLLFDLLTEDEEREDTTTAHLRFDIAFLARRLRLATAWATGARELAGLPLGYFGASTGAAAALIAASVERGRVRAVVSRGGRPDLAGEALGRVIAPTLLLVGSRDQEVLELNREALRELPGEKRLEIVPGATHLFEEPGALDEVARLAGAWFAEHLIGPGGKAADGSAAAKAMADKLRTEDRVQRTEHRGRMADGGQRKEGGLL
jgi:putative phosphoribosyl transferase